MRRFCASRLEKSADRMYIRRDFPEAEIDKTRKKRMKLPLCLLAGLAAGSLFAGLSDLNAVYRNGQVFLTWREQDLPADARLEVRGGAKPVTQENFEAAPLLAGMLNTGSAEDWWLDVSNFLIRRTAAMRADEPFAGNTAEAGKKKTSRKGFVIEDGGSPISPEGGLHVHTPRKDETGKRFFAVVARSGGKVCGFASLAEPVEVGEGFARPIALTKKSLAEGSCKGLPLIVQLHGRGGGAGVDGKGRAVGTHIIYVPRELAWREGIPFKFQVRRDARAAYLTLNDRVWIGRVMDKSEISDGRDRVKAISTFWMGYNTDIARSLKGPKFVCDNYTERYIVHLIRWAQTFLGTDPAATYVFGGSMGGTGAVQLATHFPDVFAAAVAHVPVYSYTWKVNPRDKDGKPQATTSASMGRIICSAGKFTKKNPAVMPDGKLLEDYLNGAKNINRPAVDMPPIIATNGRQDASIPWVNNPDFYRAAGAARQAFFVFWNDRNHARATTYCPPDMKARWSLPALLRFRLDRSFPAFSRCSDDKDCGDGDPSKGDITGWINRGFDWKVLADTPERYAVTLSVSYPGIVYPVTADVTLRRRQQFKFPAGTRLSAAVGGEKREVVIDENGLLTVEKVTFKDAQPLELSITK